MEETTLLKFVTFCSRMVFTEAKLGGRADDEVDPGAGVGHHGPGRGPHHPRQDVPQGSHPGMSL
jgi:hypothetical protein